MIYLTAINDISDGGKFSQTVENIPVGYTERMWGITELSSTTFKRITKDDWVLFYHKGFIIGISKVKGIKVDRQLSVKLWGSYTHNYNGQLYWDNILILSDYNKVKMPFSRIIELGGYKENFSVRRLINLNDAGIATIKKLYTNESSFIKTILKENRI